MAKAQPQSVRSSGKWRGQLEALLLEFDRQWTPDAILSFARRVSGDNDLRQQALIELIRVDLEHWWASGRHRHVDDYLSQFPELGHAATVPPELIHGECQARERSDQPLGADELKRRFPAQAKQVQRLIAQSHDSRAATNQPEGKEIHGGGPASTQAELVIEIQLPHNVRQHCLNGSAAIGSFGSWVPERWALSIWGTTPSSIGRWP